MENIDHGQQNAAGWYSSIAELVAALEVDYGRLAELKDERDDYEPESVLPDDTITDACREYEWAQASPDDAAELQDLITAATLEGEPQTDAEAVRERIQEGPLSVEVRSGWYEPGDDSTPEEFCILLSTGGPALRLMGDLDEHGQPTRAYLQYQDWGTPWTDYWAGEGSGEVLLTYAQQFYFGE